MMLLLLLLSWSWSFLINGIIIEVYFPIIFIILMNWDITHSSLPIRLLSFDWSVFTTTSRWGQNEHDCVSNHRRLDRLLNCLFKRRLKKTSKPRVTGLCKGNSPVTGEFPAQRTSNAENVSIWWRHPDISQVSPNRSVCLRHRCFEFQFDVIIYRSPLVFRLSQQWKTPKWGKMPYGQSRTWTDK